MLAQVLESFTHAQSQRGASVEPAFDSSQCLTERPVSEATERLPLRMLGGYCFPPAQKNAGF